MGKYFKKVVKDMTYKIREKLRNEINIKKSKNNLKTIAFIPKQYKTTFLLQFTGGKF